MPYAFLFFRFFSVSSWFSVIYSHCWELISYAWNGLVPVDLQQIMNIYITLNNNFRSFARTEGNFDLFYLHMAKEFSGLQFYRKLNLAMSSEIVWSFVFWKKSKSRSDKVNPFKPPESSLSILYARGQVLGFSGFRALVVGGRVAFETSRAFWMSLFFVLILREHLLS